jgi:hypothetical protein
MTLHEAFAVKALGLTKERIIAHLRTVTENNLRADIRDFRPGLQQFLSRYRRECIGRTLKIAMQPRISRWASFASH